MGICIVLVVSLYGWAPPLVGPASGCIHLRHDPYRKCYTPCRTVYRESHISGMVLIVVKAFLVGPPSGFIHIRRGPYREGCASGRMFTGNAYFW